MGVHFLSIKNDKTKMVDHMRLRSNKSFLLHSRQSYTSVLMHMCAYLLLIILLWHVRASAAADNVDSESAEEAASDTENQLDHRLIPGHINDNLHTLKDSEVPESDSSTDILHNHKNLYLPFLRRPKRSLDRTGKLFSVFSIVSFPNEECVSNLDSTNGTCLSPADCRLIKGISEGSCASGFGVCCVMRLLTCGGVVTTNTTQLQNPSFPAYYSVGGTCVYLVKRQSDNICQIRLDFTQFSIGYSSTSPTGCVTGTTDILSFSAPNQVSYPSVCGDIAGQHMYFDVGVTGDSLELTFSLVGDTNKRQWNILVTQLACTDPWRAPADCFQYHTGIFGNIQSFNFANGQMLSSQAYRICFRQELDYCAITYTASLVPTPDSFELLTSNAGTTTTVGNCKTNYVGIPQGGDTGQMDSRAQRYCGKYFDSSDSATRNGQVTSTSVPFDLFVFSDTSSITADKSAATGFSLNFQQKLCNGV